MNKPDSPQPNIFSKIATNVAWVFALIFPKKSKPAPKPLASQVSTSPSAVPMHPPVVPPARPSSPPTPSPAVVQPSVAPKPTTYAPVTDNPAQTEKKPGLFSFRPARLFPAFWTVASILSIVVNIILIVTLIIVGKELFTLKRIVGDKLLGGLYENFILMDQAHIKTDIAVVDQIPISFNLPISQDTVVTLTEPTFISNVMINLNSGGLTINSPANITLPAGTNLPVHLELTVPVETSIPITLNVPVDIPLQETELHRPFVGLQGVVSPYYWMLDPRIESAANVEACNMAIWFCDWFFSK